MTTALPSDRYPADRVRTAHERRPRTTGERPARNVRPARERPARGDRDRSAAADVLLALRLCVGAFVAALVVAIVLLVALRDAPGAWSFAPSFAAAYLAAGAWLTASILMTVRRPTGMARTPWIVGGAGLLVACFAVQALVARGGGV